VHEELSESYKSTCSQINTLNLAISTAVTMAITYQVGGAVLPGAATVVAGMCKSWVLYAKYDTLTERHLSASGAFGKITDLVTNLLAEMSDQPPTKVRAMILAESLMPSSRAHLKERQSPCGVAHQL
jgi:hypothetical protein